MDAYLSFHLSRFGINAANKECHICSVVQICYGIAGKSDPNLAFVLCSGRSPSLMVTNVQEFITVFNVTQKFNLGLIRSRDAVEMSLFRMVFGCAKHHGILKVLHVLAA